MTADIGCIASYVRAARVKSCRNLMRPARRFQFSPDACRWSLHADNRSPANGDFLPPPPGPDNLLTLINAIVARE